MAERILTTAVWSQIASTPATKPTTAAAAAVADTPADTDVDMPAATETATTPAAKADEAAADDDQTPLRLLQILAELCAYCGQLDEAAAIACVSAVHTVLNEFMPLPPAFDETATTKPTATPAADQQPEEPPSLQFSHAECLLYALHALGKQAAGYFAFADDAAALRDFRTRLQYLARGTQGYIKRLQEALRGKTKEQLNSAENRIKVTALKTTSNISTLIRDLFHAPPSFKAQVQLSWQLKKATSGGGDPKGGNGQQVSVIYSINTQL